MSMIAALALLMAQASTSCDAVCIADQTMADASVCAKDSAPADCHSYNSAEACADATCDTVDLPPDEAWLMPENETSSGNTTYSSQELDQLPTPDADPLAASNLKEHYHKIQEILKGPLPPSAGDVLYAQLAQFRGKSSRYAFDRLGYPDKKLVIEGATVYSWVNETNNLDGTPLRCTVKVVVRGPKIASTDFFGNDGACARFARSVDPTFSGNF